MVDPGSQTTKGIIERKTEVGKRPIGTTGISVSPVIFYKQRRQRGERFYQAVVDHNNIIIAYKLTRQAVRIAQGRHEQNQEN